MNFIYSIYFYNSAPHFYYTFTIYKKKNIIFCFTIFFGELSNLSYKLDVKPAAEEDAIIGTYYLNREAWTGIPLAYHSEGVVNYDLLKEFRHMVGYCEPNHIAVVEKP